MSESVRLDLASLDQLETLYATAPPAPLPRGIWRGHYLHEHPMAFGERAVARAMFKWTRFGLDLDEHCWWLGHRSLRVARFRPRLARSRWRHTDVIRLDYRETRPRRLRGVLYDELKPLANGSILGLGGINRTSPWFFFALEPERE
ncbi:MAG: hypothetical protein AB7P03_29740 [Kofleriaceae bacterium]